MPLIIAATLVALGATFYTYKKNGKLPFSSLCGGCCAHKHHNVAQQEQDVYTFALIKPDAVSKGYTESILEMAQNNGFTIERQETRPLTPVEIEQLYGIHKERPFFTDLVAHISSGPVVVLKLKKDNAVQEWRNLMGSTNPETAQEGTIRKQFGSSVTANAVHGSDSIENAAKEMAIFGF